MEELILIKNIMLSNSKYFLAVFCFYCIDFMTGFAKAIKNKNISSAKLRGSVSKALEYIAFLLVGVVAVYLFNAEYAVNLIAISLCAVEFTSICENAKESGFKFPDKIINLFEGGQGGE